jgi:hypothetical protein
MRGIDGEFPVIIALAYQLLDHGLVEKWAAYVLQDGHLVVGVALAR